MNSQTWTSLADISDLTLKSTKEIPLAKLIYSRDSLNEDVTIWTFRDGFLTIVKYDYETKNDSLIGKYKYSYNDKGILRINLQDNTEFNYKVGIVSTGRNAVLLKTK